MAGGTEQVGRGHHSAQDLCAKASISGATTFLLPSPVLSHHSHLFGNFLPFNLNVNSHVWLVAGFKCYFNS